MPKIEVTALDILTSDNQYPDRLMEATSDIINNAEILAVEITELLEHYGKRPKINSGFRTPEANKAAGGSINSSHCYGRAVDFSDTKGEFGKWCIANVGVLASLDLYIEDPQYTKNWLHCTNRKPRSGKIVFKP